MLGQVNTMKAENRFVAALGKLVSSKEDPQVPKTNGGARRGLVWCTRGVAEGKKRVYFT